MSTLKIIFDNAADRATITASSTSSVYTGVSNLVNEDKTKFHRSVGKTVTYTLTWVTTQSISGVGLPATNLTSEAIIRVQVYDSADLLVYDSADQWAAPGQNLVLWQWNAPLNANAFAYGGATKSVWWLDDYYPARRVVITLSDVNNPAGFIDNARLVVGGHWQTEYNPDYGAEVGLEDMSTTIRTESGVNFTDRAPMFDVQSFKLSYMPETDRATLMQIMRSHGVGKNLFISVVPRKESPVAEQDWIIYGKRENSLISYQVFQRHSSDVNIKGW